MNFVTKHGHALKFKTACLVIGAFEEKLKTTILRQLDTACGGAFCAAVEAGEFKGRHREVLSIYLGGKSPVRRVLVVGLGQEKGAGLERLRQAVGTVTGVIQGRKLISFALDLDSFELKKVEMPARAQAVVESILLASYRFDRYKTEKKEDLPPSLTEIVLLTENASLVSEATKGAEAAEKIGRGVLLARDLVNEPGNIKSPEYLADRAREVAAELGFKCTVLGRFELEAEGMGALLGVAQGSVREPRLIVLEYGGGNGESRPIALVGKGVVFDAGGISLKPAEKMDEMKMDMAGAAAVLGTLMSAALLKLPVNLVGVIPAVENMPSGSAIRPGDILKSASGKTIEVINTDAEGRLILADALTYVRRFDPRVVIDLATLTGACIIALGSSATAVLGNHEGLIRQLIAAGETTGDRLWQLPLWSDYSGQIKSDVADVKNTGGRPAGTITAAAFLQKFAEDYTWAHLDIAGTAWEDKGRPCAPKGATGVGVRLLIQYLSK